MWSWFSYQNLAQNIEHWQSRNKKKKIQIFKMNIWFMEGIPPWYGYFNPSTTKGGSFWPQASERYIFLLKNLLYFSVAGDNCILKIIKLKWISWHKQFEWKKIPKCEVLENSNFSKITKNVKKRVNIWDLSFIF